MRLGGKCPGLTINIMLPVLPPSMRKANIREHRLYRILMPVLGTEVTGFWYVLLGSDHGRRSCCQLGGCLSNMWSLTVVWPIWSLPDCCADTTPAVCQHPHRDSCHGYVATNEVSLQHMPLQPTAACRIHQFGLPQGSGTKISG